MPAHIRYAEGCTTFEVEIPESPIVTSNLAAAVPDLEMHWNSERGIWSFGMDYFPRIRRILLSYYSIVYLETTLQDGSVTKVPLHTKSEGAET